MSERAWRSFFVCAMIVATALVAALIWGCTTPTQDAAVRYSQAIEEGARASAPLTPAGTVQDAIVAIGAAAGAVVTAVGAWKLGARNERRKSES